MKIGWLRVVGLTVTIALAFIIFTSIQRRFPLFEDVQFPIEATLISTRENVGQEVSSTLWGQRQLDVVALAFLLFATATCCRAMLRVEGGRKE